MSERWRDTYDSWKLASPYDEDGPDPCACLRIGGRRVTAEECPVHGYDPDCEYDRDAG